MDFLQLRNDVTCTKYCYCHFLRNRENLFKVLTYERCNLGNIYLGQCVLPLNKLF